jgi:hypothetical protein
MQGTYTVTQSLILGVLDAVIYNKAFYSVLLYTCSGQALNHPITRDSLTQASPFTVLEHLEHCSGTI